MAPLGTSVPEAGCQTLSAESLLRRTSCKFSRRPAGPAIARALPEEGHSSYCTRPVASRADQNVGRYVLIAV
ncbi:hypothetical protein GY45DRAFT_1332168 [Cubamyces sp. BRFM 1775]|nr:hypothetical protein GY45DRAFT_1332168 [Cubamyces sp. BRFM 1775]